MIELRLLGPVEVSVNGDPPPRELLWRKNLALLAYLARSPERRRSREHLIGMLWGEKPDAAARHSLNEALRVLRKSGGEGLVASEGDQLVLSVDVLSTDADGLEELLAGGNLEGAAQLVRGPFLEGFGVPDSSVFEDWLAAERVYWSDRMGEVLRDLAERCLGRGDPAAAQEATARAVALDPFSDAAIRLSMLAAALRGERAGALGVYEAYASRLAGELGIDPDPETEALAERIRREREWRLPAEAVETERWTRRVPLVGRERELETALGAVLTAFRESKACIVSVQGDSGSGKTRLGEEIAARARLEGAAVAAIRAVPGDREVKWSGLVGLTCSGLLQSKGAVRADPAALAFALEQGARPSVESISDIASGADPEPPPRALAHLVRAAAAAEPVLVWVDGAEYLDDASGQALPGLVRDVSGTSCALLLTHAAFPPRPELDELRSRAGHDVPGVALTLGPLDDQGLAAMVRHVLPHLYADAADRLARRISVDSAGVPLLALELLNAVRLGLELDDVGGVWPQPFQTMEQTYPGDLPDSVVAAIRIGFRKLTRPAQRVLASASVLEERCQADRLSAAAGIESSDLFEALDELEWNRWLVAEPRGYAFVARIVREVVARDMLTPGQRRRIREAVSHV